jgi:hypothetical protein
MVQLDPVAPARLYGGQLVYPDRHARWTWTATVGSLPVIGAIAPAADKRRVEVSLGTPVH